MYREFFRLKQKPFALAPDPRFVFMSDSHREALAHLLYGIEEGHGFIVVIGQVGTGKTTLCRTLLEQIGEEAEIAYIFNPSPSEIELLSAINREFGLPTRARTRTELVQELNDFLLRKNSEGRRVLLIIDEAQNLEPEVLEQVRLLSNLETDRSKLIQILLIGQPELEENLERDELRQLNQRISVRWKLKQFGVDEVQKYLAHRLRVAGRDDPSIFTRGAVRVIQRHSKGIPRLINSIADRALLLAYTRGVHQVDARIARRAAVEVPASRRSAWRQRTGLRWTTSTALLALGLAGGAFVGLARSSREAQPGGPLGHVSAIDGRVAELAPRLGELSTASSSALALDTLLDHWGYTQPIHDAPDPGAYTQAVRSFSRLRVFATDAALDQLLLLDLPAVLELDLDGERRYAALVGADGDGNFDLALDRDHFRLSPDDLERLWTRRVFYLWSNFKSLPVLEPGMTGSAVRWVQARLSDLGYLQPGDPSGEYDVMTIDAVRAFQRDRSLEINGQVGPSTMIALYQALDYDTPRLSSAGGAS
jgi:general secretion pathway protein A